LVSSSIGSSSSSKTDISLLADLPPEIISAAFCCQLSTFSASSFRNSGVIPVEI
jgi:hypothetical protein